MTIKLLPTADGHLACPRCGAPLIGTLVVFHYEVKPVVQSGGGHFGNMAGSPDTLEAHGSDEEFINLFCDAGCGWEWNARDEEGNINREDIIIVATPTKATHYEKGLIGNYRICD